MQLKNLVEKKSEFKIKMNRILQLAYNAGQLNIFFQNINKFSLPEQEKLNEIKDFVLENKLDILDTYISQKTKIQLMNY